MNKKKNIKSKKQTKDRTNKRRTSSLDVRRWLYELEKLNIKQFEFANLPEDLKNKAFLMKASSHEFIKSIGKNSNGRKIWKIEIKNKGEKMNER